LDGLPKTLDATYERTLLGIDEEKWQFAHRLFQCLSVSVRPLRVEELAEIMAVRFDAGALPQFDTGWKLSNAEEAVLSACSSLVSIVNTNGSRIVQFAHFSVKEFLTSDRLAIASQNLSRYHIVPYLAHATLAQASLGVLLQLNDRIDKESIRSFPLADYAARHWFNHCQLGNVSATIQDATKCLFDREKPHFSAWVWIYDIDDPWRQSMPSEHPERPEAAPVYYAILCGLHWLVEHLIVTYPGDVNSRGGCYETPLLAAVRKEDVNIPSSTPQRGAGVYALENGDMHRVSPSERIVIVRLLLEHNADVNLPNEAGEIPLYWASRGEKKLEISRLLVERGANVHSRNEDGWTPLKRASHQGHLDVVRFLIDSGADVNSHDNEGWTPLHSASREGHVDIVELLIQHGADVSKQTNTQVTPLHLASLSGNLEISQLLVQCGTDVDSRNRHGRTSLMRASHQGHLDVVRFLINSGADVNSHDNEGCTPLHPASQEGHVNIIELLIQHGVDVDSRSKSGWTPLKMASHQGHLDVVRFLIDSNADVDSRDNEGWTPLHAAASNGHLDVVKLVLERGADFSIRNHSDRTPLDLAFIDGKPEVADFLSRHMAASMSPDGAANTTPAIGPPQSSPPNVLHPPRKRGEDVTSSVQRSLYTASQNGELDIVRSLLDRGSDVNERNTRRQTALDAASRHGQLEVATLLIERGADMDSRDRHGWTPLIRASRYGQLEVARLLLDHGADVNAQMRNYNTALHLASYFGKFEVVQLLLERGANVDVRNADGQTPRQIAGYRRIVELLSGCGEHGQEFTIEVRFVIQVTFDSLLHH
jgi:ankyrin repeat protein